MEEKTGPGRPGTVQEAVLEAVAQLHQEHGRPVVGAEVLNLVEAQGHARPSARAALYRMRRDGLVGAQQVGRSYLYSPVSGED